MTDTNVSSSSSLRQTVFSFGKKYLVNRFFLSVALLIITIYGMVLAWAATGASTFPPLFFVLSLVMAFLSQLLILEMLFRVTSSPQKLAEQLSESNERIEREKAKVETVIASIGDAIFTVDRDARIVLMNAVAEKYSGFTLTEASGKYYGDIFHFGVEEDGGAPFPKYVEEVLQTGEPRGLAQHTVLRRQDGTQIAIADSCSPIRDAKGQLWGCVVIFHDSSREREIEKTRDNFFSIASHQMRTPLGSMRWSLEMLLAGDHGSLPGEAREVTELVRDSTLRMIELVNDLLNVARIDQQHLQNQPEQVDAAEIIASVIHEMQAIAKQRNITVSLIKKDDPLPSIFVDAKLFRDVIANLLSNAMKYSFPGQPIEIRLLHEADTVHIEVVDFGIGIPEKDMNRLFTRFFRAENARHSEADGSGLGLFVVKSYVEKWSGKVWAESPAQSNAGSVFHIVLPASKDTHDKQ